MNARIGPGTDRMLLLLGRKINYELHQAHMIDATLGISSPIYKKTAAHEAGRDLA